MTTHKILFTRRRWDRLFFIATLAATAVACVCVYATGHLRYWIIPAGFIGQWVFFRIRTPIAGTPTLSIEGNPWVIKLLTWLGICLLWTLGFFLFDQFVLGNSINEPIDWYHWVFGVLTVTTMIFGCYVIEKRYKPATDRHAEASDTAGSEVDA